MNNLAPLAFIPEQQEAQAASNQPRLSHSPELNRLLVAAVVSQRFCRLLLANPTLALSAGYRGQPFKLSAAERSRVLAITATSLQELAQQLTAELPPTPLPDPQQPWAVVAEQPANSLRLEA